MPTDTERPDRPRRRRSSSVTGALIVTAVGVFLLIVNLYPQLNAWAILARYWPVAIILVGIGKVWEAFQYRSSAQGQTDRGPASAMPYVVLVAVVLLSAVMWRQAKVQANMHESQTVDLGAAKDVNAVLDMATGELSVSGGADRLLNADFKYLPSDGKPVVDYNVVDGRGHIDVSQPNDSHIRMMNSHNNWNLRFADKVPLDLDLKFGAGEANLDMRGVDLRTLAVNMGTGALNLDLTGPRQHDLNATIKGGVGAATIKLPKDVGVSVHASGGIGAVISHGLKDNGKQYENEAFGKSPATIYITIEGGIGKIELDAPE